MIEVNNGINTLEAELTGKTVGQVRKMVQQALNIDPISIPEVDGRTVGEDYPLEANDHHLEFVKAGGRKGRTIDQIKGMDVYICTRDHSPPHFHVSDQKEDVSFKIADCQRLFGAKGLERYETEIRKWWQENRDLLRERWNELRPTDCSAGPIRQ